MQIKFREAAGEDVRELRAALEQQRDQVARLECQKQLLLKQVADSILGSILAALCLCVGSCELLRSSLAHVFRACQMCRLKLLLMHQVLRTEFRLDEVERERAGMQAKLAAIEAAEQPGRAAKPSAGRSIASTESDHSEEMAPQASRAALQCEECIAKGQLHSHSGSSYR